MGFTQSIRLSLQLIFLAGMLASTFRQITGETVYMRNYKTGQTTLSNPGRILLEGENVSKPKRHLADTVRVDPLDNFKKYRGGYDITNKHYWSSTAFTGIPGYAIAIACLLAGVVYGGFLLITNLCCKRKRSRMLKKQSPCSKHCHFWPVLLAMVLTLLAIVASGVVLGGTAKFHSKAKTVINIIIETAEDASRTIFDATGAMKDIQSNLDATNQGGQTSVFLSSTTRRLDVGAADLQRQARKNRRLIGRGLKIAFIATIVTISFNLIAAIALSVTGVSRLRRPLCFLITLCWLLTVLCWCFFGIYFFLDKFAGDTCTAFEDFQRDPRNNSLSSILPCDELLSAKTVLLDVSAGIYRLVNQVNANIKQQVNANISVLQGPSNPNLLQICNPFSEPPDYQYQPNNCPTNSIRIGDIPQVLRVLTCTNGGGGTCRGGELISASDFRTVEAYTSSIQNLLNAYPGMQNLVDCKIVTDAFSEILSKHCKPMKDYAQMVWAALIALAIVMVALVMLWTVETHHDRRHHFSEGSVKPHSEMANMMESGSATVMTQNSDLKTQNLGTAHLPEKI